MKCPHCAMKISNNANICPYCNNDVSFKSRAKSKMRLAVGITILLLTGIGYMIGIDRVLNSDSTTWVLLISAPLTAALIFKFILRGSFRDYLS